MAINMKLIKSIILFLFTFSNLICIAQSGKLTGDSYSKAHPTEKIKLKSSYVSDREYIVHITYAVDSLIPGKKYPVLYYTDAWTSVDYFNLMGNLIPSLKSSTEQLSDVCISHGGMILPLKNLKERSI